MLQISLGQSAVIMQVQVSTGAQAQKKEGARDLGLDRRRQPRAQDWGIDFGSQVLGARGTCSHLPRLSNFPY